MPGEGGACDALTAACHAVSLLEDDPLFNAGRGAVFNVKGEIEMEASVMVSSVHGGDFYGGMKGGVKRYAAVSGVQETRHPVLLAREVLIQGDESEGDGRWPGVRDMHGHVNGRDVEEWGWKRGLERKEKKWFWTKKRWEEHLRGLKKDREMTSHEVTDKEVNNDCETIGDGKCDVPGEGDDEVELLPSQGTVGAVCMDSWGNLCVATSTGGLTNKRVGRIGDTPTVGAGFWAGSWEEKPTSEENHGQHKEEPPSLLQQISASFMNGLNDVLGDCIPTGSETGYTRVNTQDSYTTDTKPRPSPIHLYNAVAMSGTGNGDSFLRLNAVRTAASLRQYSCDGNKSLAEAVTAIAGPGGELQQSAGERWSHGFEGEGGIIGIEARSDKREGKVVFDFNCGGMWRAWIDGETGEERCAVYKEDSNVVMIPRT